MQSVSNGRVRPALYTKSDDISYKHIYENPVKVSVIIPVYNRWQLTRACLHSLAQTLRRKCEVIVVDNGSTDATAQDCPEFGKTLFGNDFIFSRHEANRNFAPACNEGARLSSGDLLFFLNNDTILIDGWLEPLLDRLASPPCPAAVGPLLLYPELAGKKDRVQHLGLAFEPQFYPAHLYEGFPAEHPACGKTRRFQALTGAALLVPRGRFLDEGLFDEDFVNGGEDVEFGLRLTSRGQILTCEPRSKIYHLASQTPGIHDYAEHNARMLKEKALGKIVPDLHLFAKEDGYELALTPALEVYLNLPERRKALLARQVDRLREPEELEALLIREPVCHYGYDRLADLYRRAGQFEKASATLFLALKMRKAVETAKKLADVAELAHDDSARNYAMGVLSWYQNEDFTKIDERAEFMAAFMEKLGISALYSLYAAWVREKDSMRSYYKN